MPGTRLHGCILGHAWHSIARLYPTPLACATFTQVASHVSICCPFSVGISAVCSPAEGYPYCAPGDLCCCGGCGGLQGASLSVAPRLSPLLPPIALSVRAPAEEYPYSGPGDHCYSGSYGGLQGASSSVAPRLFPLLRPAHLAKLACVTPHAQMAIPRLVAARKQFAQCGK